MNLLRINDHGLYCTAGDFYIDPWRRVEQALITHAHSDHARPGCRRYLTSATGALLLRERVGPRARIVPAAFGEKLQLNGVTVSFHPAGHILGSAQIRLEYRGEVWVVSGDYKTQADTTCEPFEPIRCHTFITECTFGLPVFRWRPPAEIFAEINHWWRQNQERGQCSVLFAYALGKAQRLLAGVEPSLGPIFVHETAAKFLPAYAAAGVRFPTIESLNAESLNKARARALVIAPASVDSTPWLRKFGPVSTGFASGWMQIRGRRRARNLHRGFVLSDHADWPALLATVRATGAQRVLVTHGYTSVMVRYLLELGLPAEALATGYEGETLDLEDA